MKKLETYIGRTFEVRGLNEPRKLVIVGIYKLGKYKVFECNVKGNYSHFKDGQRENFDAKSVIPVLEGNLPFLKILTA